MRQKEIKDKKARWDKPEVVGMCEASHFTVGKKGSQI